ncbi:MAG: glutamine synthetase [Parachlamydia sp.]|nr:MAG: glutamine synthetase [Parachlamydia sp.]
MNPRFNALQMTGKRNRSLPKEWLQAGASEIFGVHVFNRTEMQKMLPRDVVRNIQEAMAGKERIIPEYANQIAFAMKEWAIKLGATHYSHWFQPLTGATAEKHDAFIDWETEDQVIEKFSGKQLIQGEPDASSFPSGGLRTTFEARGYTGWDPTSPVFIWEGGDGVTLCIPSVFFSWTGDVLDSKIPLLRSDKKLNHEVLRLLKLTGIEAGHAFSTVGLEQEYFVIDRGLRNLRPDLVLMGRTVFGAASPKGQQMQDHYFGCVKDRILAYMREFEIAAFKLGIPVKTRHNEVAPAQHEVAPVFEKSAIAVDHNILLMELMRQTALKHDLTCLLHEKPFQGVNGSGKHCNWSIGTDTGINLFDPTDTPENNLHFLILLTATLAAVHKHATLLRASIGSAGNDFRLGAHEAPPAIMSVYLGDQLETILEAISQKETSSSSPKSKYDLGLQVIPELTKDYTDRNRTSPFAFTGNKFEFRAVGSSANPAMAVTVLNVIVADSLHHILNEIEKNLAGELPTRKSLLEATLPVIRKSLLESASIRFSGDNYSEKWEKEAQRRQLPNLKKSLYAFEAFKSPASVQVFKGILNEHELNSRYEILLETYSHTIEIESKIMVEMFRTQILPVATHQQKEIAKGIKLMQEIAPSQSLLKQKEWLEDLSQAIEVAYQKMQELEEVSQKAEALPLREKAVTCCEKVVPKCAEFRQEVDRIESLVDDAYWQLPKYRELLFMV